ncbi:hypothetical protein A8V01_19580 [Novosphingobium guangzhouense]|uniref:Uncharacterized protein n=2 Tax=Novosphingobium guangzhouense TaxID=1850347 RepID=A0A2K2G0T5_9SPHN|nr:hypothetical protein A8V01_19580 [Novosphingobium guangzhouense]
MYAAPKEQSDAMADVREKLATIVTGLSATRDDIGKLSQKLDSTADGLADVKAEVAGMKAAQQTAEQEMSRLRDRMRQYEDGDRKLKY